MALETFRCSRFLFNLATTADLEGMPKLTEEEIAQIYNSAATLRGTCNRNGSCPDNCQLLLLRDYANGILRTKAGNRI